MNKSALFLMVSSFIFSVGLSQITYTQLPKNLQLYPRDSQNSAQVDIAGTVTTTGYNSIIVQTDTNGVQWKREEHTLNYSGSNASFSFGIGIYADTVNFSFHVILNDGSEHQITTIDDIVCGDVYLIQGQSNAVANVISGSTFNSYQVEWVRSFGSSINDATTQSDTEWGIAQADSIYSHAAVGIWGLRLGKLIVETHGIPVCILNGAVGSTKSVQHKRNGLDPDDLTTIYGRLLWRAENAAVVNNVKAMIWWQGESNSHTASDAAKYNNQFPGIRDGWRTDYSPLNEIYTTQLHAGYAGGEFGSLLREYQRVLAEGDADTEIMTAHNLSGFNGEHFSPTGYDTFAVRIFHQIERDFYNSSNTTDIDPPNISDAYFVDAQKDVLVLEFSNTNTLVWQNDSTVNSIPRYLKDYFYFNTVGDLDVNNVQIFGNLLRLQLNSSSSATSITYLTDRYYYGTTTSYIGPWLKNSKEIPALSFLQFPVNVGGDDPLPVTLSIFTAEFNEGAVKLKWRTESEINNLGFILLRKEHSQQIYQQIASYENNAALQGQGTTTQPTNYEFIDSGILAGYTYNYLLMAVDYNGKKVRHGPLTVTAAQETLQEGYNLYQNYPNPFNPDTHIAFFLPQEQIVHLRVFDILGREVAVLLNSRIEPGYHEIPFSAENLKSGFYFYKIDTTDYHAVKKMLLTK